MSPAHALNGHHSEVLTFRADLGKRGLAEGLPTG